MSEGWQAKNLFEGSISWENRTFLVPHVFLSAFESGVGTNMGEMPQCAKRFSTLSIHPKNVLSIAGGPTMTGVVYYSVV